MAPSSACATCSPAPTPRCRCSAPRVTCCAQPPGSSPSARTEPAAMAADKETEDPVLVRFRQMSRPVRWVYARPRTFLAFGVGIAACILSPASLRLVTRLLVGWDSFVALYLLLVYAIMLRNAHHRQ